MKMKKNILDFGFWISDLARMVAEASTPRLNPKSKIQNPKWFILLLLPLSLLVGCERNEMHRQAIVKPLETSDFFADGRGSRTPPPGTVARDELHTDHALYDGKVNGQVVDTFPFEITPAILARGQERFDIYCSVCHGYLGDGNGMIAQRGMVHPPSYHIDRLRNIAVGHFFDVMTNGYGAMYSYADRISTHDRWAIAAYIRALQLSQHYPAGQLTAEQKQLVDKGVPAYSTIGNQYTGGAMVPPPPVRIQPNTENITP